MDKEPNKLFDRALVRRTLLIAATLFAAIGATAFAYWPGLAGPFLLDDLPQLNGLMEQSGQDVAFLFGNYLVSDSGPLGRPVSMATFIADALLYGSDTWWWKYHSLMLHLTCGAFLFWFAGLIAGYPKRGASLDTWLLALVVAAVWLLHPLLVSTVLYTVQRMTILSTLFVFAGLVAYVKGRILQAAKSATGWILVFSSFVVFLPLATASKETGVLLAAYCFLLEFCVFRFAGSAACRRSLYSLYGTLIVVGLLGVVLIAMNPASVLEAYDARDFTLYQRLLTEFRVLGLYLKLILVPLPILMGFFHDDFETSRSLFDPLSTLLWLVVIVAVIVAAIRIRHRYPLAAFGVLLFFTSHALESTIFALELVFEHRNYIGSAGIILAVVSIAWHIFAARIHVLVGAVIVITACAFLTWQRSNIWSDPVKMYSHMYAAHPESSRLNSMFAHYHAGSGDFLRARQALAKMKRSLGQQLTQVYFDCLEHGDIGENSLPDLSTGAKVSVTPHVANAISLLVGAVADRRCTLPETALLKFIADLEDAPAHSVRDLRAVDFSKAKLLESVGDVDGAVNIYMSRQSQTITDAVPTYLAADLLARQGRYEDAREMLRHAAEIEKSSRVVRQDLAVTIYTGIGAFYVSSGHLDEALATYSSAVASIPDSASLHLALADVLVRTGRYEEAMEELRVVRSMNTTRCLECGYRIDQLASVVRSSPEGVPES